MATSGAELSDIFGNDGHPNAWKVKAACIDLPSDMFFETASESVALEVCRGCPVTSQCLAFAMDWEGSDRDRHGVFGGLTAKERNAEYRRRHPRKRVTHA